MFNSETKYRTTILLVDDENIIIDVRQAMLEKLGYQVVVSTSGLEAIENISSIGNKIDLVILDLIMLYVKSIFVRLSNQSKI